MRTGKNDIALGLFLQTQENEKKLNALQKAYNAFKQSIKNCLTVQLLVQMQLIKRGLGNYRFNYGQTLENTVSHGGPFKCGDDRGLILNSGVYT